MVTHTSCVVVGVQGSIEAPAVDEMFCSSMHLGNAHRYGNTFNSNIALWVEGNHQWSWTIL